MCEAWGGTLEGALHLQGRARDVPRVYGEDETHPMSTTQLHRYDLPRDERGSWAIVVLGSDGFFSAVSDYGNYAYLWSNIGTKDAREFFIDAHERWTYFANKLSPRTEYDADATLKLVKEYILSDRRNGGLSKEEARVEWDLLFDCYYLENEYFFNRWIEGTRYVDAWDFRVDRYPCDVESFCTITLKRLSDAIKKEIGKEKG